MTDEFAVRLFYIRTLQLLPCSYDSFSELMCVTVECDLNLKYIAQRPRNAVAN